MQLDIYYLTRVHIRNCEYIPSLFADADEVPLEQILSNCIHQRDELLEIKKLSERQSTMLKKLRETIASGESLYCYVTLCYLRLTVITKVQWLIFKD